MGCGENVVSLQATTIKMKKDETVLSIIGNRRR